MTLIESLHAAASLALAGTVARKRVKRMSFALRCPSVDAVHWLQRTQVAAMARVVKASGATIERAPRIHALSCGSPHTVDVCCYKFDSGLHWTGPGRAAAGRAASSDAGSAVCATWRNAR